MAAINFINYVVDTMYYKTNPNFDIDNNEDIIIDEEVDAHINIIDNEKTAIITLRSELKEKDSVPFSFEVRIVGYFEFDEKESDGVDFKDLLKTNAVAILFPYLRAIVSELTGKSNRFPNYNMPVRNIAREMAEKNNITITE
ncbi:MULTISPECIES: protein-export chaperone SecB [Staphylococcus intermedius group]|uniref:Protein-export chaperone SecB n=2 Tax=Staphylococcus intermedius group TaxID=2815305 RepID=A0AAQ0D5U2_9STAP|nr:MULTISPECIES: protein-export chaperone SecB [Staphylococcus intermedius group]PCF77638.1 pretranslocase subunit SecB family protein [Staphylococcus delphini]PNZ54051.1 pretranslocase subunit SecB family protein [Staphylococcus intermedius NCTC 11048]QUM66158.1 protein-export chaperone SecB [Staphylococcus delphini]QUM67896.1 protein-export chaperone SecB [Staphylococcus delphini]QUM68593.1 protein-export chaperone SecB [Staphylococcus delphini]